MNIALDAFGGDHAPGITIAGAVKAVTDRSLPVENRFDVTLVGSLTDLTPYLPNPLPTGLSVLDVPKSGELEEHEPISVNADPESPIRTALRLHAEGAFDAVVSAGSTGAQVLASLFELPKCSGITRPAIGALMPTARGRCLLADVGASLVATPHHLVQFAAMGCVYVRELLGIENPRVGLINVAGEASAGERSAVEGYRLLSESGFNFVGFLEGRDIPEGKADVAVTNGFVGNTLLKFAEGLPALFEALFPSELVKALQSEIERNFDYQAFGGEPLLGVRGVSIICHGASNERAISSALKQASRIAKINLPEKIEEFLTDHFTTYYSQVKYLRSFRRGLRNRD